MTDSTKKRHFFEEEEEEDGDVPMKSPIKTPKRVPIVQPACDDDVSMSRSPSPERPEQEPMSDLAAKTEEPPPRNNTAVHFFETTRDVEMTEPQQQQEQTSSTTTTVMTSSSTQESTPSSLSLSDKVDLLRAIVGEQLSESQLVQLLNSCKGDMELAVNAYFATTADASPSLARPSSRSKWRPDRKYFGEIIVEGWSTSKGPSPVRDGEQVVFERSKHAAASSPAYTKRSKYSKQPAENVVVRFRTTNGREIGRLSREDGRYISKLLDYNICSFHATVVYVPPVLQTGVDIVLMVRCYFTDEAFTTTAAAADNRSTQYRPVHDRGAETDEERMAQERTLAILYVIWRSGLKPTRSAIQRMNMKIGATDDEMRDMIARSVQTAAATTAATRGTRSEPQEEEPLGDEPEQKELSDDQLDTIYEKAQSFDAQLTPMDEPDALALTLKPYQKRALAWMVQKESVEKQGEGGPDMRSMHPLWEEYAFPKDPDAPENRAAKLPKFFYFNPYTGELSLKFPELESQERGGILADEMGLGKTIEILSLIHTNRFIPGVTPVPSNAESASPTTLVVCPMSLLAQWRDEVVRASKPGTICVEVYYGDSRSTSEIQERLCRWDGSAPDILVTTYGVLMAEWSRSDDFLSRIEFWRVVLDEAHHIKNRLSKTSRACCAVKAPRRWAVTGTPIQNKLEDLFALVKFLKQEPWASYTFWRTFISLPFERKDPRALAAVKTVLEPLVLRRTKNMRDIHGNPMVPLPPKQVNIEYLQFSEPEKDIYDSLYTDSKTKFSHFCAAGKVLSHYASIFQLLMRLRQVACHPYLVVGKKQQQQEHENNMIQTKDGETVSLESLIERFSKEGGATTDGERGYGMSVLQRLLARQKGISSQDDDGQDDDDECPICLETVDTRIMMPCMHMACRPCVMDYLQKREDEGALGECPICRAPIKQSELIELSEKTIPSSSSENNNTPQLDIRQAVGGYKSSAKIDALLIHLRRYEKEGHKTVVFSQFTGFLDIIEVALKRENIRFTRLDGKQSQAQREQVLAKFSDKTSRDKVNVLLISLRAGGVGLNLTCASRVLMMDPWWNFAVEAQAIDRVHRLGQDNAVIVTRFIMRGTVEERILEIQNRKHALVNELYMSRDEARNERLHDLEILFGTRSAHHS